MRDRSIRFRTERFDYQSDLPEDANAGNRFYGRDVAEFLATGLTDASLKMEFIDEDWGWLVFGKTTDNKSLEVAIYNLSEDDVPGQSGTNEWGLWLRSFEKQKWLGILSKSREVEFPAEIAAKLSRLLQSADIVASEWQTPRNRDA
jgi:hypothetical protein